MSIVISEPTTSSTGQWRSQVFECGVHEKPDLLETFHERRTRVFGGRGIQGPALPVKIEFGIGGDTISRCFEGLTCTIQSLLSRYSSYDVLNSSPPQPSPFLCKFGQIAGPQTLTAPPELLACHSVVLIVCVHFQNACSPAVLVGISWYFNTIFFYMEYLSVPRG